MLKSIKKSFARRVLPRRHLGSHKGQNGRVLIVGGSLEYHGAPIIAGLGALYSGADLVFLYVPECNFDSARSMYPDFIVRSYPGDHLTPEAADAIIEFGKHKADSVVIGPGLTGNEKVIEGVQKIVMNLPLPTVLDADAILVLKKIDKFPLQQQIVITPHQNEFRNLVDREVVVTEEDAKSIILLRSLSMDLHINVLLKGHTDFVSSGDGHVETNKTGNPGMTVGGSGDALAGFVGSLLSRGVDGYDAARCAAYYFGCAGDLLKKTKGVNFSASDLAMALPSVLK